MTAQTPEPLIEEKSNESNPEEPFYRPEQTTGNVQLQPPYGYNPYYYYPYPVERRTNPVVAAVFWIFYALVGFWVDFSLTLTLWVCAIFLPLTLPLFALKQNGLLPGNFMDYDHTWIAGQSEAIMYAAASITSIIGVLLLIFAIVTAKPWAKLHGFMFRELGGLKI